MSGRSFAISSMLDLEGYLAVVDQLGGTLTMLTPRERHLRIQHWRQVFAAPLHRATGKWKDGQFEWHVFSGRWSRALNGGRAQAAYAEEAERWTRARKRTAPGGVRPTFWLVPEDAEYPAYRCEGARLPDLSHLFADAYVWPDDASWTMAFTHEASAMDLGPYFSRREWVDA